MTYCSLRGEKHMEENAHWDCSLSSSCGKWPRQVREIQVLSGRKEEGTERGAAGHLWGESGPLTQRRLYLGTPGPCPLDHQGSKVLTLSTLG